MKALDYIVKRLVLLVFVASAQAAIAADPSTIPVGVGGYDLVSYHQKSGPTIGNGHHTAQHKGVTYLFSSSENKAAFLKKPEAYLPAYGGYCAFGVSKGKKFYGDPQVWRVVDDTLYLNLDKKIQGLWLANTEGNIEEANTLWAQIKATPAAEL